MFEIDTGTTAANCEGVGRREFIKVGALSAFGLSLPTLLRAEARAADATSGRPVSCILLWLNGGPSHIDTWDPKPDAPAEIRGEFGTIPTTIPGYRVTDLIPRLARRLDKYSVLRSVTSSENGHERAAHYLLTGYPFNPAIEYPSYGSVFSRELQGAAEMPSYVLLGGYPFGAGGAGYMGDAHNPFNIQDNPAAAGFRVRDVSLPGGFSMSRVERRRSMLATVDVFQRRVESAAEIKSMESFYEKAYALITSPRAKEAFDLEREPASVRERYGKSSRFGQSCLLARRLVESGVRFVTVNHSGWDTHQNNFNALRSKLPDVDQAYSALLDDLAARGLLEDTIVICMGEFGRTPKVNPSAGRDHWGRAISVCIGGGTVKTGMIIGATNERAEEPIDRPIRVEDLAATIYRALGVDFMHEYLTPQNRPVRINYDGQPVDEILTV